jgi:uncharacterized protein YceH (UPF0502 family)
MVSSEFGVVSGRVQSRQPRGLNISSAANGQIPETRDNGREADCTRGLAAGSPVVAPLSTVRAAALRFLCPRGEFTVSFEAVDNPLTDIEARVLGALIEKDVTTPDYYPLSLNALVNACNQKSNRDPVMNLDEESVRQALGSLNKQGLAGPADSFDGRVTKYEHRLQEAFNFDRRETAILCVLLLRGPQTPGELRSRGERMHPFDDLSEVESTLQRLMKREPPIVKVLPRQPGTKEARYAHLFSGDVEPQPETPTETAQAAPSNPERLSAIEGEVSQLRNEIADLKREFSNFRKQFET